MPRATAPLDIGSALILTSVVCGVGFRTLNFEGFLTLFQGINNIGNASGVAVVYRWRLLTIRKFVCLFVTKNKQTKCGFIQAPVLSAKSFINIKPKDNSRIFNNLNRY